MGQAWELQPEMELPACGMTTGQVIRTVARFDFSSGLQGWYPRHPDVHLAVEEEGGGRGGRLHITGRDPSHWNFAASPVVAVEPGHKYRARMQFRIESNPAGSRPVRFKIELVQEDGSGVQVNSPLTAADQVGRWLDTSVEFRTTTNCRSVWAALEKGSEAPASIDLSIAGFVIEEIREFTGETELANGRLCGPIASALLHRHPRLYFTRQRIAELQQQLGSDARWSWARSALFRIADSGLKKGPPDYERQMQQTHDASGDGSEEQLWQRDVGNMIPHLALAFLMSQDRRYLDAAQRWILASLAYPTWGLHGCDGLDLAAGHQLEGIGLAYDWLYDDLDPAMRLRIRIGLQQHGARMARAVLSGQAHWSSSYMQNHLWVNCAGLATAGFSLCDEVDEARGWVRLAHGKFLKSLDRAEVDGASHEGYGYWEYGAEACMRYMELAHDLLGINLYESRGTPHPWLEQSPLYALYLAMPCGSWSDRQSVIDLADCPRTHWYGPSAILHNLARRYPASPYAGLAQWLACQDEARGVDAIWSSHYLNLAWSDPSRPQTPPDSFPLLHHFRDLDIVSDRSDWSARATQLVIKCGPPLGHRQEQAPWDYGAGHVHPDAGHITLLQGNQFILRDEGYSHLKLTSDHNTVLVDGKGQKGEGHMWFDYSPWLEDRRAPRILSVLSTGYEDTVVCDVAPAYPRESGVTKFIRTVRFIRPFRVEILDDLEADRPVIFEARFHLEVPARQIAGFDYSLNREDRSARITFEPRPADDCVVRSEDGGKILSLANRGKQRSVLWRTIIQSSSGMGEQGQPEERVKPGEGKHDR